MADVLNESGQSVWGRKTRPDDGRPNAVSRATLPNSSKGRVADHWAGIGTVMLYRSIRLWGHWAASKRAFLHPVDPLRSASLE
jgi:hypothetical protein